MREAGVAAHWLEQPLLPGCGLVLAFAALALGATPAWALAATVLLVLVLLGVWLLAGALQGELSFHLPSLVFPLLAILALACLQAFAGLSVYPPATREAVWELAAAGGLFLLLVNQFAAGRRRETFASALVLFAFFLAVFAILQGLSFSGKIYWSWPAPRGSSPFGPFINRNHYAAWGLMVLPLAWAKFSERRSRLELRAFWGLVALVVGISILFSRSRAGLGLFLLAFPLYAWLSRPAKRGASRRVHPERVHRERALALAVGLGIVLLAGLVTLAVDSGALSARWPALEELFIRPEALDEHRWQIWRDTWPMIRDHLWLGSGLETYGVLSDSYRSFYSNLRWLQAHNDYLQWLAETGLVGAGLAVWFLVALARRGAERLRQATSGTERRLVAAALTGCLLVLLHSLVDFPLRIPANALLFAALLAMIAAPAAERASVLESPRPGSASA
ncbi:MAG TPA: O-antigen ligase family protein [Candidatus Acidoferrales bacterium]|nr:O-antigen ligase family protein [Candidatus Acidoferrales bacterium]